MCSEATVAATEQLDGRLVVVVAVRHRLQHAADDSHQYARPHATAATAQTQEQVPPPRQVPLSSRVIVSYFTATRTCENRLL